MSTRSASVARNHVSIRCRARGRRRSAAVRGHRPSSCGCGGARGRYEVSSGWRTGVNGSSASTGSSNVG
eukprot:5408681-Pleurochrysis_carterae.AAC.1